MMLERSFRRPARTINDLFHHPHFFHVPKPIKMEPGALCQLFDITWLEIFRFFHVEIMHFWGPVRGGGGDRYPWRKGREVVCPL